jgi:hypothetical protein
VEERIKYIFMEANTPWSRMAPSLEMPTSTMAHVKRERERESTPAKQQQGKA